MNCDKDFSSQKLPDLLFLHGLTAKASTFNKLSSELNSCGALSFTPHLTGQRANHPFPPEVRLHNIDLELSGYLKLLRKDDSTEIIIVAQSMGALLALRLAHRYPELIKGLILLSPSMALRNNFLHKVNSCISYIPSFITQALGTLKKEIVSDAHKGNSDTYTFTMLKHLGTLRRQTIRILPLLSVPVTVIQNKNDYHLSPYSAYIIKELAINSEVKLIVKDWGIRHSLADIDEVISIVKYEFERLCLKK